MSTKSVNEPQTLLTLLKRLRKTLDKPSSWSALWDTADKDDNPVFEWHDNDAAIRRHSLEGMLARIYVDERPEDTTHIAANGPVYYELLDLLDECAVSIYADSDLRSKEWCPAGFSRTTAAAAKYGHSALLAILNEAVKRVSS